MTNTAILNEIFSEVGIFLTLYSKYLGIGGIVGIVLFILQGFGILEMSKSLSLKNPWLGFIPFVNYFAIGRLAENYIRPDSKKSAKWSAYLLASYIITVVLTIAFLFLLLLGVVLVVARTINLGVDNLTIEMFTPLLYALVLYFLTLAAAITFTVFYYISLWKIYSIFDKSNAVLFLILSILFNFITPIFLFIIRKKTPDILEQELIEITV